MKYDVVIIGAGPAGIFTALELVRNGSDKKILMVEKGKPVDKRHCPKAETGKCMNCKPNCMITTGFSGAGAFSDGKLSLSCEVGGELPNLIGSEFAQELIDYTDKIYLEFGADEHVEGVYEGEEIKEIRKRAIRAGLQLVNCPIRHLGTEKAQQLYLNIQNYLQEKGVEMRFNRSVTILFSKRMSVRAFVWKIRQAVRKSTLTMSLLLPEEEVLTGWKKSARRMELPISRGPLISVSVSSAATRSWR